jgi:hypothetical protein
VDRGWFLIRLHAASTLGHRCASGEAAAWLLPEGRLGQHGQQHPIGRSAARAGDLSTQDPELMSQDRDLDVNVRRATDPTRPRPKAS